jgi:hypothetical protein
MPCGLIDQKSLLIKPGKRTGSVFFETGKTIPLFPPG